MGLFDFFGGGKAPKIPQPTDIWKVNKKTGKNIPARQVNQLAKYYATALPSTMATMAEYGPAFMQQGFDFGAQGVTGFKGLRDLAATGEAKTMADLRAEELGLMTGQAGQTRGLMEALSPEQARAVELQRQYAERAQGLESEFQGQVSPYTGVFGTMAQEAFARRGVLSPEEQRATQQAAREAGLASGRLGGTSAIAAEIQNREAALAARRAEAQQAAQTAYANIADVGARRQALRGEASRATGELFNRAASFYTAPSLELLSRTPASYTAGTTLAGTGLGLGQSMTPQLDYNLGLNLARERAGALDQANLAQYQADMQASQARSGMLGSLIGLAAIPFTGGLSAGLGLTGLAGGAAGATGLSGLGLSAGMGLSNLFGGGPPRATPV